MKAHLFAVLNGLPIIITGYHTLKVGPYLRNEKSKRKYSGYFNFQKNIIAEGKDRLRVYLLTRRYPAVYEPEIEKLTPAFKKDKVFIFSDVPTFQDYFGRLKIYRQQVKELFFSILKNPIKNAVKDLSVPVIGVHIRMGDFRKLDKGEIFKGGLVRTPEDYFIDSIDKLREINGPDTQVSVFTDGYKHEFERLFTLKNIDIVEGNADIVDMLLLSKSKIIVTSPGSTFSYWAGFLSDAPLVLHPEHIYEPIRNPKQPGLLFEGPISASGVKMLKIIP